MKEIFKFHIEKLEKLGFEWFADCSADDEFICGFAINLLEISGD